MARLYLWVGVFFVLSCQLCAVFGDNPVSSSSNLAPSSEGGGVAMYSDVGSIGDEGDDDGSCIIDEGGKPFFPSITNPFRYMVTKMAGKCFPEMSNVLEGLHPASSAAATTENASTTSMGDNGYTVTGFFCSYTRSLMQMMHPVVLPANGDGDEKDTDEDSIDPSPDELLVGGDDDDPPLCPRAKNYATRHGSEAVDTCSVQPMDRTEHYDYDYGNSNANAYANANAKFNGNGSDNDRGDSISIVTRIDDDTDKDIDTDIGLLEVGTGLYLHESQPSVCPAATLSPPVAAVLRALDVSYPLMDRGEFVPRWKQQRAAMGDNIRLDADVFHEYDQDMFQAEARRAVAAGEPFTLEAFIAATDRKEKEKKALEEDVKGKSLALRIEAVVENVSDYVGSLLKEILPAWINPTAGQIRRADECFSEADSMPLRPEWDLNATKLPSIDVSTSAGVSDASNAPHSSVASGANADVADYDGGGWFFCAYNKRLVQQDPAMISLPNAITGRSAASSTSHSSPTEHFRDEDDDDDHDAVDSLLDALLAADRTRYEHEHMQLTIYVAPDFHVAELADEHAGFEAVLESIFERDEQEAKRVALEMRIATDMQHLLFGGGDKTQLDEEKEFPLPGVCHETEHYSFLPLDAASMKYDVLFDFSRTPPTDDCTPLETLHGNDHYASSRSDCHVYLQKFPFRYTPVSIEENASFFETPGSLFDLPEMTPQLDRQLDALECLIVYVVGVWTDVRETAAPVVRWLQLRLTKVFDHAMSLVDYGSTKNIPKLAQGSEAVPMSSFIGASMSRTGSATFSRTVAKYAGIVDIHFGAVLPKNVNPARYIAIRQAERCFEEVDSMLQNLRAASSYAAMAEKASTAATDAASDTTTWFFCAHTQSLVQMDPAVLASHANVLTLSPLFAEDRVTEEDMQITVAGHFGRDVSRSHDEQQPARESKFDQYGDDSDMLFDSSGRPASPDRDAMPDDDSSSKSSIFCRPLGLGCRPLSPRAATTDITSPATAPTATVTTIVTTSQTTVVTVSTSASETTTITFSADTPTTTAIPVFRRMGLRVRLAERLDQDAFLTVDEQ